MLKLLFALAGIAALCLLLLACVYIYSWYYDDPEL